MFGNTKKALAQIEIQTEEILDCQAVPFMLGGEHLVTLGAFRAVQKKYPDVHMIHFDAHAGSAGRIFRGAAFTCFSDPKMLGTCRRRRIYQFGIRSGDREEFYWGKDHVTTRKFDFEGLEEVLDKLEGKPVYLHLKWTCWIRLVFPGTGTPAGGVTFDELRRAAEKGERSRQTLLPAM